MTQEAKSIDMNNVRELPFFEGYPYLVIRIEGSLFHINLLSAKHSDSEWYFRIAQAQVDANKLDVCLITGRREAVFFSSKHKPCFSEQIALASFYTSGRLRLALDQPADADLLRREGELEVFIRENTTEGFLFGDLTKGGREATQEDLINLQGVQENGIPRGLVLCPVCGDYRGDCIDPNPTLPSLVVRVSCYCENDNLCAYCGGKLHSRKLNANRYNHEDGKVWHTPSFCGLNHRCSGK